MDLREVPLDLREVPVDLREVPLDLREVDLVREEHVAWKDAREQGQERSSWRKG